MQYKYNKAAGALNEAIQQRAPSPAPARPARSSSMAVQNASPFDDEPPDNYAQAHQTGVFNIPAAPPPVHAQTLSGPPKRPKRTREPHKDQNNDHGLDPASLRGGHGGMFFFTVDDGQRFLMISEDGAVTVLQGPCRVWRWGKRFQAMAHHVAHPGEFLIARFRDGQQQHIPGPCDIWLDPREYLSIDKEDALQLAAKEAVVVYSRDAQGDVSRRIVHGPANFIPEPGEWLHTFSWHGSSGVGGVKIPNALTFQKLWLLPDQMYHNIEDVRTADDAVLTVRLMLFFELINIERMLEASHDPIGDFINAASSDVIDFVVRYTFSEFKKHTHLLNELETYRQLCGRAEQSGYRINKVVYRGYGAPPALQLMHDQAIESRTRLQLEKDTEQQAQDLSDAKLEREVLRAEKRRAEQSRAQAHEIEFARQQQQAELTREQERLSFEREQDRARADLTRQLALLEDERHQQHLAKLKELGVSLTEYLTQHRADRVIEVRGPDNTHLHLAPDATSKG